MNNQPIEKSGYQKACEYQKGYWDGERDSKIGKRLVEKIDKLEKAIEKQENETRYLKIKYEGSLIKHTLNIQRNNKLQEALREQRKERRLLQAKNSDLLVRIDNMEDRLKSLLYNRG